MATTALEPIELDGCETYEGTHPKKLFGRRRTRSFGDVIDPVAEELKDIDPSKLIYDRIPIIPFFDGGDATLRVMRRMRELSPTHGSCIGNIGHYVFGGELTTRRYIEPGMAFDSANDVPLTEAENKAFIDFVNSLNPDITFAGLLEVSQGIYENLKTYGNAFLRIDEVSVAGKKYYYFESIDCEKMRYYMTKPGEDKVLVISAEWTSAYINKYPPEFVAAYPNWSGQEGDKLSTIIHLKNKVVGRDWYGLPESFISLYWQYMEVQQGQHGTNGYANDFVARVFFEIVAEPDMDGDEDDFDHAVEQTFTNQANAAGNKPKRYLIRRRLPSDTEAKVHEFRANTDHEFHTSMSTNAEKQIIKSHNWHSLLMGIPSPGRLGQNQEFKEVYKQYYNNVIRPWQEKSLRPLIQAFQICEMRRDGKKDITIQYSLGLFNLYSEYLKQDTTTTSDPTNNPTDPAANGNHI